MTGKTKEKINIKFGIILSYAGIIVSLISNIFLQRFINSPNNEIISAQYNLYSFSSSISSLLTILTLGLTSGYVRFATKAEKENPDNGLKKINFVYSLLLSISSLSALIIGSTISILFITRIIPMNNYSSNEIKLISIFLFFGTINVATGFFTSIFTIFLNYRSKFIFVRLLTLIFSTASPLIALPFISYFNNFVVFSIVHILLSFISLAFQIIYSFALLKYRLTFKIDSSIKSYFKEVLIFTIYIFLVEIFIQIDANADKILLGFFAPPSNDGANASAVGNYNIAFSIVSVIGTSCSAVFSAYAPKINRAVLVNDKKEVENIFNRTTEIAFLVYFLIFGGFVSCGYQFINIWLGEKRLYVYYIVIALLACNLIPYTINIASEIQRAYNKHRFRSFTMLGMSLFNIIFSTLALLLVKNFVAEADEYYIFYQLIAVTVVTFSSSFLFNGIIMALYNKKEIGLPIGFYYKKMLIYFVITLIPCALTSFIYYFIDISYLGKITELIIIGSTFAALFAIFLFLFNRRFILSLFKNKKSVDKIELSNNDLKIVKLCEVDILKDIIRVCEILDIDYYCVGGTALGSIKYKGFIPWDDDIDIAMPRKDFDVFVREGAKYLKDSYVIQSIENDKKFLSTIAKVRDSRTIFNEISTKETDISGGVFVDIFPIDNAFTLKKKKICYKLNYSKINSSINRTIDYSTFKTILLDFIDLFIPLNPYTLMIKNIDLLRNNNGSEKVYCRGIEYNKEIFESYKFSDFEGLKVKVPAAVDEYLEQSYGDIRIDPPLKDQISHHFIYELDLKLIKDKYENSSH